MDSAAQQFILQQTTVVAGVLAIVVIALILFAAFLWLVLWVLRLRLEQTLTLPAWPFVHRRREGYAVKCNRCLLFAGHHSLVCALDHHYQVQTKRKERQKTGAWSTFSRALLPRAVNVLHGHV